ncbi:MAG: hypothetical protein KAR47_18650 [Planctomycetes bacterium]|nr:hypothetical protein [Planctomycetota bacterium]
MRGSAFHNRIVDEAKVIFSRHCWNVYTECRYRNNGVTTYLDLLATRGSYEIACEVETTTRHVTDNAIKALSAGLVLWVIVPSRRLRHQAERKLASSGLIKGNKSPRLLLLLGQLEAEIIALAGD